MHFVGVICSYVNKMLNTPIIICFSKYLMECRKRVCLSPLTIYLNNTILKFSNRQPYFDV